MKRRTQSNTAATKKNGEEIKEDILEALLFTNIYSGKNYLFRSFSIQT